MRAQLDFSMPATMPFMTAVNRSCAVILIATSLSGMVRSTYGMDSHQHNRDRWHRGFGTDASGNRVCGQRSGARPEKPAAGNH